MSALSFRVFPENEISFNYFPKRHLNSSMTLTSTTDQLLAFKIKTNVPICYVVKPHIGFIPPRSTIEISITMQPTDYTPQTASISDKFLINVVPLPPNTDVAALSDPARFQQIWDSLPKSLVESAKLKVVLKFETNSANVSVLDKTTDDPVRDTVPETRASTLRTSQYNEQSLEGRDDLGRSSLMQSFAIDGTSVGIGRNLGSEQNILPQFGNENILKASQTPTTLLSKLEEKDKKKENVVVREEKDVDTRTLLRNFEERISSLEKRIEKVESEKKALNQKCQELTSKTEEQARMLVNFAEQSKRNKSSDGQDVGGFQMWHILLATIIALILGAYLRSD